MTLSSQSADYTIQTRQFKAVNRLHYTNQAVQGSRRTILYYKPGSSRQFKHSCTSKSNLALLMPNSNFNFLTPNSNFNLRVHLNLLTPNSNLNLRVHLTGVARAGRGRQAPNRTGHVLELHYEVKFSMLIPGHLRDTLHTSEPLNSQPSRGSRGSGTFARTHARTHTTPEKSQTRALCCGRHGYGLSRAYGRTESAVRERMGRRTGRALVQSCWIAKSIRGTKMPRRPRILWTVTVCVCVVCECAHVGCGASADLSSG